MKKAVVLLSVFTLLRLTIHAQTSDTGMVLITGGLFIMGDEPDPDGGFVDYSAHEVTLSDFYLDKYEVTNAEYKRFCDATGHKLPEFRGMYVFCSGPDYPVHPVVGVTWVDAGRANFNGTNGHPLAVGSFPSNGYGLYDMAGNVVEWAGDYYEKDYYFDSPDKDPQGPAIGKRKVIRGGGWRSGKMCNSCSFRQSLRPYWVDMGVGFRCAKNISK